MSRWLVRISSSEGSGQTVGVDDEPVRIGRAPDNDVVIDDITVSRHHLRLVPGAERLFVEDAGSRYGTWLGGEPVTGPRAIEPGDEVQFGSFSLHLVAQPAQTAQTVEAPARPTPPRSPAHPDSLVLRVRTGGAEPTLFVLAPSDGFTTVGGAPDARIHIEGLPDVAARFAYANGRWSVELPWPRARVNGVAAGHRVLAQGDVVELGDTTLEVERAPRPPARPQPLDAEEELFVDLEPGNSSRNLWIWLALVVLGVLAVLLAWKLVSWSARQEVSNQASQLRGANVPAIASPRTPAAGVSGGP